MGELKNNKTISYFREKGSRNKEQKLSIKYVIKQLLIQVGAELYQAQEGLGSLGLDCVFMPLKPYL